jgi:hypothetical protein
METISMENPQDPTTPPQVSDLQAHNHKKRLILIVAGIVLLVLGGLLWMLTRSTQPTAGDQPLSSSEKLLDEMLAAAAAKEKVHFNYAERKFDSLDARNKGTVASDFYSVAEIDNTTGDFRAVYARRAGSSAAAYYDVGRCLEGEAFLSPAAPYSLKTVPAVIEALKQPFGVAPASDSRQGDGCQLTDEYRSARLTDGIIPIGLSQPQIEGWLQHLRGSKFIQVKDEGLATYRGKSVRKLRLDTNSVAGTGSFYQSAVVGAGLQLTQEDGTGPGPDAYRLDDIPATDNISGFYLLDEATKLPVYSEFVSASLLNNKAGFVFRHAYQYPPVLSLDQTSTIETLE